MLNDDQVTHAQTGSETSPIDPVHPVQQTETQSKSAASALLEQAGDYWYDAERNTALQGKPCKLYRGALHEKGYVRVRCNGHHVYGHRLIYEQLIGPIPDGHEIDHLCENRECLQPAHLEAVPPEVNKARRYNRDISVPKGDAGSNYNSLYATDRTVRDCWAYLSNEQRFINRHKPNELISERALNEAYADTPMPRIWRGKAGSWLRETISENHAACVGFEPGQAAFFTDEKTKRRVLNLWTPPAIQPDSKPVRDDDVEPALRLIWELCSRNEGDGGDGLRKQFYMLGWIAAQIQRPCERMDSYILLTGPQGCGKSTLAEYLIGPMLGGRHDHVTAEQISGDFGDWAVNRRMALVEEVKRKGDYTFANKIKPLITSKTFTVNPKGRTPFTIPNYMCFVMLSNFTDAVALEEGDRRCFHIHPRTT